MKKRFILFIIFILFLVSSFTLGLILNYLDLTQYPITAISLAIFTFLLGFSSFSSLILYLVKKAYFRGRVDIVHVLSSFRQGVLISLFLLSLIYFNYIGASLLITGSLSFVILFLLELFIKNQED